MKAEKNMTTGSAAPSKKRAQYWKSLRFLDTVDDERDTFSNAIVEPVDDPDIQIDSVEEQLEEVVDEHTETVHVEPTQAKECQIKRHAEPSTSTKQDKRVRKDKDIVRLLKARSEERNETFRSTNDTRKCRRNRFILYSYGGNCKKIQSEIENRG